MPTQQCLLPDVGEGLTEAEIVSWHVEPGQAVAVNDTLVEIETAKSVVELPSPFAGVVGELLAPAGTTVEVGTPIATIETAGSATGPVSGTADASEVPESEGANLVGYGPSAGVTSSTRRLRRPAPVAAPPVPVPVETARPLAKPPVRKLAKDLGVDLSACRPTGRRGEVTRQDVLSVSAPAPASPRADTANPPTEPLRLPVSGVRKATAAAMVTSAFTAPHVSLFVDVDVTRTMELVARLKASKAYQDVRVTPLLVVAKAVAWAAKRHPSVNAAWHDLPDGTAEIVQHAHVDLGIAASTPNGLMVPNIKRAETLGLHELAVALGALTRTARAGALRPADTTGGTLTITNIGVFGVDTGTPILNPGETAIVVFGAIADRPWVHEGQLAVRKVTTLGASFDHRVVDGEDASRFMADVAAALREPLTLLE